MMKLTLTDPKLLVDSINVISELVNEARFKITTDKIELVAMDPATVAMVIFHMFSSAFSEYKVPQPEDITISLDSFKAILRRAKPSDVITIELDKERNRLKIQLKSEGTRTFNLALLENEEKTTRVPELNFPLKVEMNSILLDEAIQDMDVVAESVAFVIDKDKFTVEAQSNLNDARSEILKDDETTIKTTTKETVRAKYSIEYLKKIIKGAKLSSKVSLQFNKDYPLRVDYLQKDKVNLTVILAPRSSTE